MSYRFECGLCSSVASAQLQFHPKKTQDRLIRLLVIVRLQWSEQGLMFLNQIRGLKQKKKKKGNKTKQNSILSQKKKSYTLGCQFAFLKFVARGFSFTKYAPGHEIIKSENANSSPNYQLVHMKTKCWSYALVK